MRLTAVTDGDAMASLDVNEDAELELVRELLEIELSIPASEQTLLHDGRELSSGTLLSNNVRDGDVLLARQRPAPATTTTARASSASSGRPDASQAWTATSGAQRRAHSSALITQLSTDPRMRPLLEENPRLAQAVRDGDAAAVETILREVLSSGAQSDDDVMSADAQRDIEDRIRQSNIEHNLQDALEFNPEAFARVVMLFVRARVNGQHAVAFIDTGAQVTIISRACAERVGILRLVDTRFKAVARGVGSANSIGRIHSAVLDVDGEFLQCSFTVLEDMTFDIIFGLDMLRKHAIVVDLARNCLRIHDRQVEFLAEKDIPRSMRDEAANEGAALASAGPQSAAESAAEAAPAADAPAAEASERLPRSSAGGEGASAPPPEESIRRLMQLGFSRQDVARALEVSGGNEEVAASVLAQAHYGF